jgi:hypothetical protein
MLQDNNHVERSTLYHAYVQNWRAVYDGRYRFLAYAENDKEGDAIVRRNLLFDMREDPMESNDLSAVPAHAENVKRLESLLHEQRDAYSDPVVPGGFWEKYKNGGPTEPIGY